MSNRKLKSDLIYLFCYNRKQQARVIGVKFDKKNVIHIQI